jgi:hypothetical protein
MTGLGRRLSQLENRLPGYCPECNHCNPLSQEDMDALDGGLRNLVEAIEATIRCDTEGCTRRDELRTV